jgi:hypothetical protein
MWEARNAHAILLGKPLGKIVTARLRGRWADIGEVFVRIELVDWFAG